MNIQQAIAQLLQRKDLSSEEMTQVMRQLMTGEATPAQIGGFLIALRMKGESVEEISAAADVMRSLAEKVTPKNPDVIDIVGTGGDSTGTFNVSTGSAIIAAAAGVSVAKHGNRSVSSRSGAADLLEKAGVRIDLNAAQVAECVDTLGVGFMFAPKHHSAMKYAIGPRREMAVRTVFNVLGPLTNPAMAKRQVIGVFDAELVEPIARVLGRLGSEHALVVHSDDGMDEVSLCAPTTVAEWKDGELSTYRVSPEDFDLEGCDIEALQVADSQGSLDLIQAVFNGEDIPAKRMLMLNAGAGIYVAGKSESWADGVKLAGLAIEKGLAQGKLNALVELTQGFGEAP